MDDLELYCGIASEQKRTIHCAYCNKNVEQSISYIVYKSDFDNAVFCCHDHRARYYKLHAKERKRYLYRHSFEFRMLRNDKVRKKHNEKQKEKYQNEVNNKK